MYSFPIPQENPTKIHNITDYNVQTVVSNLVQCIHNAHMKTLRFVNKISRIYIIIPTKAFARDYVITGVGLSVCLFVCLLPR